MRSNRGYPYLEVEINGEYAWIWMEQKPTLFSEGYIFIEPQHRWKKTLPIINYINEEGNLFILEGFIRSFTLLPIIVEVNETSNVTRFNKKWAGKVLYEDEVQVIKEQEAREAKRIKQIK
jgi:hypothetical protein